jgi:glutaminyl-tRNA synthetase
MSTANYKAKPMGTPEEAPKVSNFLRQIIESDLAQGTYAQRQWAGSPGDAAHHAKGTPIPPKFARVSRPNPMAIYTSVMPKVFA